VPFDEHQVTIPKHRHHLLVTTFVIDGRRYEEMMAMFRDCDLVLVEGHLAGRAIKIEVWRDATARPPLADNDRSILAVVTDDVVSSRVPVWSRRDVGALADRIANLAGQPCPQMTELRSAHSESAIHTI